MQGRSQGGCIKYNPLATPLHPWPPSLAQNNSIRQGNKADLMGCLQALAPRPVDAPEVDVKIIDGAALMYALDPKQSNKIVQTFGEFSQQVFLPYIARQLKSVLRLDVVWDVYKKLSLKSYQGRSHWSDWSGFNLTTFVLNPIQTYYFFGFNLTTFFRSICPTGPL